MRRMWNKLLKKEKKESEVLNQEVLRSPDYQALQNMNYIMNFYDNIEKIDSKKFDPMEGDELYINARFAASNFLSSLLERITKEVNPSNVEITTTVQEPKEGALVVSEGE